MTTTADSRAHAMSRPAQVNIGTGDDKVGLEYVKSRGVLRVRLGGSDPARQTPELPLHTVLDRLGIDAADVAPACQYLLFAGTNGRARGGIGDLVRVFRTEESARAAFSALRLESGVHGWGELAALDAAGRMRRMCWFGSGGGGFYDDQPSDTAGLDDDRRRSRLGRIRGAGRRRRDTAEDDRVA